MSSTTTKNLLLSQMKIGQNTEAAAPPSLTHTITNEDEGTILQIEVPGVDPSTVEVSCEDNVLRVTCERGTFSHLLESTTNISKITADIMWGMLTVKIPAPPAPMTRTIKVNLHDPTNKVHSSKFTTPE